MLLNWGPTLYCIVCTTGGQGQNWLKPLRMLKLLLFSTKNLWFLHETTKFHQIHQIYPCYHFLVPPKKKPGFLPAKNYAFYVEIEPRSHRLSFQGLQECQCLQPLPKIEERPGVFHKWNSGIT